MLKTVPFTASGSVSFPTSSTGGLVSPSLGMRTRQRSQADVETKARGQFPRPKTESRVVLRKKLRQTWWEALGARPTHQSPVSVASHQKKSLGPKVIKSDVGPREVDFGYMRTTTSCGQLGCEFQPVALVGQPLPTIGGAAGARKVSWGQPKSPSALTPLPSLTS